MRQLCEAAGVPCKATGEWTKRIVCIFTSDEISAIREPGDWGVVWLNVPNNLSKIDRSRFALAYLAYGVLDPVARESIKGLVWARPSKKINSMLSII